MLTHPVHRLTYVDSNHAYYIQRECSNCCGEGRVEGARPTQSKKCPGCRGVGVKKHRPVSVSSITGMLNKPALMSWSARLAAEYAREKLSEHVGTRPDVQLTASDIDRICSAAQQAHNTARETAADTGTDAHEAVLKLARSPLDAAAPDDVEAAAAFRAFATWLGSSPYRIVDVERMVADETERYAGRFDLLLEHQETGARALADLKTSSGIYYEAVLQLAGYSRAYNSEPDITPVESTIVLWTPKDGRPCVPVIRTGLDLLGDEASFDALVSLYGHKRGVESVLRAARKASDETLQASNEPQETTTV